MENTLTLGEEGRRNINKDLRNIILHTKYYLSSQIEHVRPCNAYGNAEKCKEMLSVKTEEKRLKSIGENNIKTNLE